MSYDISDAEWQVMHVIWERGRLTAQEVIAALEETTEWSPTTIKTMLHRLVRKKVLGYSEEKNRYQYFSRVKREDCVGKASQSFLERVFGGEAAPLLAHFVRTAPLSQKELAELRRILKEQEAKP